MQTKCTSSPNRWLSALHQRTKEVAVDHSIRGRGTRVYLGPFRKGFPQTVAAPLFVHPAPESPFSIPLDLAEPNPSLVPSDFNIC
jgi:hypothetical protein